MAKYLGLSTSDARGAQGGIVFSRNRYGVYTRGRVSPINPRSTAQIDARNLLEGQSIAWRGISGAEQTNWNTIAAGVTWFDSLGQPYSPSGHQLFISANCNRLLIGSAALTAPGGSYAAPAAFSHLAITSAGGPPITSMQIEVNVVADTPKYAVVAMTPPLSLGVSFFRPSLFRVVYAGEFLSETSLSSVDVTAAYLSLFGTLPLPGSRVAVRARVVTEATGWSSSAAQATHDFPA